MHKRNFDLCFPDRVSDPWPRISGASTKIIYKGDPIMTIHELSEQLHSLSVGGYFNREKFSVERLQAQIEALTRTSDSVIFEIALPDGWWYFKIYKYGMERGRGQYDYYIPETRDQELRIKNELFRSA